MERELISIIVPTYNESPQELLAFLETIQNQEPPWELLFIEGGSKLPEIQAILPPQIPTSATIQVLQSDPGRGKQMNYGSQYAKGSIFLFLHLDLRLPPSALKDLRIQLKPPYIGGGFFKKFYPSSFLLRLNEWILNRIRFQRFGSMVGTNGMFCHATLFQEIQGFPDWPFLEDVEFSDRLKKKGPLLVLSTSLLVSSRKYQKEGILKRTLKNLWILFLYRFCKRSPEELSPYYYSRSTPPQDKS